MISKAFPIYFLFHVLNISLNLYCERNIILILFPFIDLQFKINLMSGKSLLKSNSESDMFVSDTDTSQDSIEIVQEIKDKSLMRKVFSDSSAPEDVTPVKKKKATPPSSPVFLRSSTSSKTLISGIDSSKNPRLRRELELCRTSTGTVTNVTKNLAFSSDDSIDDLLNDTPNPSPENSIKKSDEKCSSPRKNAIKGRSQVDDDSPPATQLSRGTSSFNTDSKCTGFGDGSLASILKASKSSPTKKKGMFDGLFDDDDGETDRKRGGFKFKFNLDDKKKKESINRYFKKSDSKIKSKLNCNVNDKRKCGHLDSEGDEVQPFKNKKTIRNKSEDFMPEGSGNSQEGTSKSVKRKLEDSGEKSKYEQENASKRNPFKVDKTNMMSRNNNDSSEEESKDKKKFSFNQEYKEEFKSQKSKVKKSNRVKESKSLNEFDMFSSAGNMTKKKTQEESSFLANPSCSSQKSSKSVNILNVLDDTNENNFMKTIKKRDRRSTLSISKMSKLSQSISQASRQSQSSLTRCRKENDEVPDFSFKKNKKKERSNTLVVTQPKLYNFVKDKEKKKNEELALTIDELLSLPEKPDDEDGKSMDELLDELDVQIAEQKEKDRLKMEQLDEDARIQQKRKEDREARYAANAVYRDRLATEVTRPVLLKMFANIREYLEEIREGVRESSRHQAFHKSLKTRQALLYTMITHPFTDKQVDWVYEEMSKIWMRTKKEHVDNNEYIWKVLMPECFIRLYSDLFKITKKEAELKIKETPFDDSDESSDSDSSSGT